MQKLTNDPYENYPTDHHTYGEIRLRNYQSYVVDEVIKHCRKSADPAVVSATVGAGKSLKIAAVAKHVSDNGGMVLVLSRTSEIIAQDAEDCWSIRLKNSIFSAGLGVKSTTYPVILGTEGTVARALATDEEFDRGDSVEPSKLYNLKFDAILVDENHQVPYDQADSQYMNIFRILRKRNPKVRIVGFTGTPFKGMNSIIGQSDEYFWRKQLCDISTKYLTDLGYLVPITYGFGHDDVQYDLSEFQSSGDDGIQDFNAEELRQMEAAILKAETRTEKIALEVVAKTKEHKCILFACAGKKHMKELSRFLPKGQWAIVSDETPTKKRQQILKDANEGKIKYLINTNCLTVGVNIPFISCIVLLRKISSLVLLTQLIGRGLRLLKPWQVEAGYTKDSCLVLDYAATMDDLRDKFEDPQLEEADLAKSKEDDSVITCPKCGEMNGKNAVRCRGVSSGGDRCDFFWRSRICEPFYINGRLVNSGCGAENAPTARSCRCCDNTLIDPNAKLLNKAYTENDFIPVTKFDMRPTQNGGVAVEYHLVNGVVAKEFFPNAWDRSNPKHTIIKRMFNNNLIKKVFTKEHQAKAYRARNAGEFCQLLPLIKIEAVTHRKSGTKDIISKVMHKVQ